MKTKTDTVFYRIGQLILIPFILFGLWFARTGYENFHSLLTCAFYRLTGFPCPGCGGTRAFCYLFRGDVLSSVKYHPVVLYGILAWFHFMGLYYCRHHFRGKNAYKEIQIPIYLYIAITIILIQWLVKIFMILL